MQGDLYNGCKMGSLLVITAELNCTVFINVLLHPYSVI